MAGAESRPAAATRELCHHRGRFLQEERGMAGEGLGARGLAEKRGALPRTAGNLCSGRGRGGR